MEDEQPTSAELAALSASRKSVIASFKESALDFETPSVRVGDGLSQRGNFIWADRRNPNLPENPLTGGSGVPAGVELREVTVIANARKQVMRVMGTVPEDP